MRYLGFIILLVGCQTRQPIVGLPICNSSVILCSPEQTRDGKRCASCTSANDTLTCQSPDFEQVVCVSDCGSCDHEPEVYQDWKLWSLEERGVHLCGYDSPDLWRRKRDNAWCATCATPDLSMTTKLCDSAGFCDYVVCVAQCDTCPTVRGVW